MAGKIPVRKQHLPFACLPWWWFHEEKVRFQESENSRLWYRNGAGPWGGNNYLPILRNFNTARRIILVSNCFTVYTLHVTFTFSYIYCANEDYSRTLSRASTVDSQFWKRMCLWIFIKSLFDRSPNAGWHDACSPTWRTCRWKRSNSACAAQWTFHLHNAFIIYLPNNPFSYLYTKLLSRIRLFILRDIGPWSGKFHVI